MLQFELVLVVSGGLNISPVSDCTLVPAAPPECFIPPTTPLIKVTSTQRKKEESIRESAHKDILPTLTPIKRETLPSPEKKDIIKHKNV